MFVAFTESINIATNYGLCATYVNQKIGTPVTFVKCEPNSIRQSTWEVVPAGANPAPVLFCINSQENRCIGINTATGVGQLVDRDLADPAQQFTPLTPGKISRFTNGLWGTTKCAEVRGSVMVMKNCDASAPRQQLFTYGPNSRMAAGDDSDSDFDFEYQQYQQFGSYHPAGNQQFSYPYYPYQYLHY